MHDPSSTPPPVSSSSQILSLDDHDESVRIAVRALGDMRNNAQLKNINTNGNGSAVPSSYASTSFQPTPALSMASSSTTPSLPSPSPDEDPNTAAVSGVVHRVSNHPLFNTALRAYEQGKASSRVVKYGAEMMESSVKTIGRPVIDRLPVNVDQLDEFAGRQLDRLERYRRPSSGDPERMQTDPDSAPDSGTDESMERGKGKDRERCVAEVPSWLEASSPFIPPPPPPPESRTPTPLPHDVIRDRYIQKEGEADAEGEKERAVAQRSRWTTVLTEAGGISAALSEESMRRLKYCLQWLQYATAHIDAQILILRDFIASLQPPPPTSSTPSSPTSLSPSLSRCASSSSLASHHASTPISPTHLRTLTDIRHDVVHTIRQVVDVVSKYAGGALPGPARARVRGFILHLPQRWASAAQDGIGVAGGGEGGGTSTAGGATRRTRYTHHRGASSGVNINGSIGVGISPGSSRASSPLASPRPSPLALSTHPRHMYGAGGVPTAGAATAAAQRILTLATESLDMMRGVTGVVGDSLDRADAWVGRLRVVGLQRERGTEGEGGVDRAAPSPAPSDVGIGGLSLGVDEGQAKADKKEGEKETKGGMEVDV